jgi:four helix bundle protein
MTFARGSIYEVTSGFPVKENHRLSGQIQGSAVSVSANLAGGQARNSKKNLDIFPE